MTPKIKKCCGVKPISSHRPGYDYCYFLTCSRCGLTVNMSTPRRCIEYWNYKLESPDKNETGWADDYEVEQ